MTALRIQNLCVADCEDAVKRSYFEWGREIGADGPIGPDWDAATEEQRRALIARGFGLYDGLAVPLDNNLTALDAYVSVGISSRVTAQDVVRIAARACDAAELLARLPADVCLNGATDDELATAADLIALLAGAHKIKWGKATKVLHKERPALFAIVDSVVFDFLRKNFPHRVAQTSPPAAYLHLFKELLRARDSAVAAVRRALAVVGVDISAVRVLDFLLWIGWRDRVDNSSITSVWGTSSLPQARVRARDQWEGQRTRQDTGQGDPMECR